MAITLRASGAWAAGSTSVTPALPAGIAAGDIMLLYVGCKPDTATIVDPSGWTNIAAASGTGGTGAQGVDTGAVAFKTYYRLWQSGDAAPTVSITSGNVTLAVIHGYSKTLSTWQTPIGAKGSDTSSGTGFSLTMDADPGVTVNDLLAHFATIAGNNATFGTPTITATSATIGSVTETPATEGTTTTGNDLEASASYALVTAGTGTAAPVCGWTLSVAQTGAGVIVRLREAPDISSGAATDGNRDWDTPYQDITLTFNRAVDIAGVGAGDTIAGLTVQINGGTGQALTYRSGTGTASWVVRVASLLHNGDTLVVDYDQASGIILAVIDSTELVTETDQAITNSLTKRVRIILKDQNDALIASETVKYGIFQYDSGVPGNADWMTRDTKGTAATSAAGLLDVEYTGAVAVTADVYVVVIRPNTTPTESMVWTQAVA